MKKFSWILLGSILLTGCSNYSETSRATTYIEEEQSSTYEKEAPEQRESQKYYRMDDAILNQTQEISDELYKKYKGIYYYKVNSSGQSLNLDWEIFEENNLTPGESEWAKKLDEVFPGIQEFMRTIDSETRNKNPQSMVINNASIKIKPTHLYKENEARSYNNSSYMTIENEPIVLTDEYFKQLEEVVAKDRFITHTPYIAGDTKMLRFSTPSLQNRNFMTLHDENGKISETYYEEKAVGYQVFVADNQIQKIRVVFNKIKDEQIEPSYFDPLLSWCKDEWHMEGNELEQVKQLIEQVIQGEKGSEKEHFGNYEYRYKAKQDNAFRYANVESSEYKEMLVELVIEPK